MGTERVVKIGNREFAMSELAMGKFLLDIENKQTPATAKEHPTWPIKKPFKLTKVAQPELVERLGEMGLFSPLTLAEMAIRGDDPVPLAERLHIPATTMIALYHFALERLTVAERRAMERAVEVQKRFQPGVDTDLLKAQAAEIRPGQPTKLPWAKPEIELNAELDHVVGGPMVTRDRLPAAVDHTPYMGPVRNQEIGTCYAFAAVAEREYYENRALGNGEKVDLSEQYAVWAYRKGQRGAGMSSGSPSSVNETLSVRGVCTEPLYPYLPKDPMPLPAPTRALDYAKYYKNTAETTTFLTTGDVNAAKTALAGGHTICICCRPTNWNISTGEITMPAPDTPQWEEAKIANHAVVLVGYVDNDTYPGGGFFILRNSWGAVGPNLMGDEYNGHLRMPYDYYKNFAVHSYTLSPNPLTYAPHWLAEYYDNPQLAGVPVFCTQETSIAHDWGTGGITYVNANGTNVTLRNNFSARWTAPRYFKSGWYRIHVKADDGVRVKIDDALVLNHWHDQPPTIYKKDVYILDGVHTVSVEYYESQGNAIIDFDYQPVQFLCKIPILGVNLPPSWFEFREADLQMEFRHRAPIFSPSGVFTVTAEGQLLFDQHTEVVFHAQATGGIEVKLDGDLVINELTGTTGTYVSRKVDVSQGLHTISVKFKNDQALSTPAPGARGIYRSFFKVIPQVVDWQAAWYNNRNLEGVPVQRERLEAINFNWDSGSPTGVSADNFSGLLSKTLVVDEPGRYLLSARSDDGVRCYVNHKLVIDSWVHRSATTDKYVVELPAGRVDLAVEYFEATGNATLAVDIQPFKWQAQWYANVNLQGNPVTTGPVNWPNFNWDTGAPMADVPADYFSVRMSTALALKAGRYRFCVTSDDGVRLYVKGQLVIDAWLTRTARTDYADIDVVADSELDLKLEYFAANGAAALKFDYLPIDFCGEYYEGATLGKSTAGVQMDPPRLYGYTSDLNFDWAYSPPDPRLPHDNFSARWFGALELPPGRYTVKTTSNDGVRVFMDGRLLIDNWQNPLTATLERHLDLAGRWHNLKVEYYELTGMSSVKLDIERG